MEEKDVLIFQDILFLLAGILYDGNEYINRGNKDGG